MPRTSLVKTQNRFTYSEDLSVADLISNITVTGELLTDSVDAGPVSHYVYKSTGTPRPVAGCFFYASCSAKAGTKTWIRIIGYGASQNAYFDLANGVCGTATGCSSTIEPDTEKGAGWYRCTIYGNYSFRDSGFAGVYYAIAGDGIYTYQGNGTGTVYMDKIQYSDGYSPYVMTEATAHNATSQLRSVVPTQQNWLKYSEVFSNVNWGKNTGVTATDATAETTDPWGTNRAGKIVYDGSGLASAYRFFQALHVVPIGSVWTMGMWLKVSSGTLPLRLTTNASGSYQAITVTTDWQYFSYAMISTATGQLQYNITAGASDNSAFTLYIAGASMASGVYEGGYIMTDAAPRNTAVPSRSVLTRGQNLHPLSHTINSWVDKTNITVTNATTDTLDPFGGNNAAKIMETAVTAAHYVAHSISYTVQPNNLINLSFYAKPNGRNWVKAIALNGIAEVFFDIANGTIGTCRSISSFYTQTTTPEARIESVGNSWYRCSAVFKQGLSGYGSCGIQVTTANDVTSHAGDITKGVFIDGFQVTSGTALQPLTRTTGTAVTLHPQRSVTGLSQNLLLQSEDFTVITAWTPLNLTVSGNTAETTDPLGTNLADKITDTVDGVNTSHYVFQSPHGGLNSNVYVDVPLTYSIYAKKGTKDIFMMVPGNATGQACWFNLTTGTVGLTGGGVTSSIEAIGDGWYRCKATITLPHTGYAAQHAFRGYIAPSDGATTYQGDGTGTMYLWGAQVEIGETATPYRKTTTAPLGNHSPRRILVT